MAGYVRCMWYFLGPLRSLRDDLVDNSSEMKNSRRERYNFVVYNMVEE